MQKLAQLDIMMNKCLKKPPNMGDTRLILSSETGCKCFGGFDLHETNVAIFFSVSFFFFIQHTPNIIST